MFQKKAQIQKFGISIIKTAPVYTNDKILIMLTYLNASISLLKLKGISTQVQVIILCGIIKLYELKKLVLSGHNYIATYYIKEVIII